MSTVATTTASAIVSEREVHHVAGAELGHTAFADLDVSAGVPDMRSLDASIFAIVISPVAVAPATGVA